MNSSSSLSSLLESNVVPPASQERIQTSRSATEVRILSLLGSGTPHNIVASATGVSESYISQLLSQEEFKNEVTALKYKSLSAHNERDASYDSLEDKLRLQLERNLPLLQRPMEILKALQVVNKLDRRGTSSTEPTTTQSATVELLIPNKVVQQFTLNINNQVINVGTEAGSQTLETMQSSSLLANAKARSVIPELSPPEISPMQFRNLSTGGTHEQRFNGGVSDLQEIATRIKQTKSITDSAHIAEELQDPPTEFHESGTYSNKESK